MSKIKYSLYAIVFLIVATSHASAEYCNMIGSDNNVAWIHIPRSQFTMVDTKKINIKGKLYSLDRSKRLLLEDGLPDINKTVTLNNNISSTTLPSCLTLQNCSNSEIERLKIISQVDKNDPLIYIGNIVEINTSSYECTNSSGQNGCWDLSQKSKIKILSYPSIDGLLFALVQVVSC